jgi:NADH-quinone oxidoreductase subunit J
MNSPGLFFQFHFYLFGLLAVAGALLFVTRKSPVAAALWLVNVMFCISALFVMLDAPFIGAIQVLVYAGAIMTLFVFVVMVLNREESDPWAIRGFFTKVVLGLTVTAYLTVRSALYLRQVGTAQIAAPVEVDIDGAKVSWGGVQHIGHILFNDYLFPFEAVSLLLLVAVIGAVVVARIPRKHAPTGGDAGDEAAPVEEKHG